MKALRLIFSTFIIATSALSAAGKAEVGKPLPKLSTLLPGQTLPKTDGKIVLVDFWASWCGPCQASFATMSRLQDKYGPKGFVIIGVGVDDKPADYQKFLAKKKPNFSTPHDVQHKAAAFFAPKAMPTSYLIDRKGIIRYIHSGFVGKPTEAAYIKEIEALLAEK